MPVRRASRRRSSTKRCSPVSAPASTSPDTLARGSARHKALAALRRFRLLLDHMKVEADAGRCDGRDPRCRGRRGVRARGRADRLRLRGTERRARKPRLPAKASCRASPRPKGLSATSAAAASSWSRSATAGQAPGISLPLGVLRLDAEPERRARSAQDCSRPRSSNRRLRERGRGRAFYMVGGSWRALARIDMLATDFPLPITHQYRMKPARARELRKLFETLDPRLSSAAAPPRLATSPVAAMLLELLVEELEPSQLIVSTYGIREGLLYSKLKPSVRRIDPLIEEARDAGGGEHRFGQHGDLLDAVDRALVRRRAGDAAIATRLVPARRRRVAGEPRLPRRPRNRNGAARQLGRGEPAGTRDHGPGAVIELRARPAARRAAGAAVQGRAVAPRALLGIGDAPRPAAVGRRRFGAEAHQPQHSRTARCS